LPCNNAAPAEKDRNAAAGIKERRRRSRIEFAVIALFPRLAPR
jgi:hypothetical protein